jgi:outer membrane protein assembly factor BamB/thioredoxin-like negative regulator of GroEL
MTDHGLPAAENDVEALILGDTFAADEESCITDAVGREVTMRGDLQQMPLADVFQSLGMSKMEGVLRVRNVVEQREIYFRDGLVRSYIPTRVELRRIGVQLVQGGLLTPESLRTILFEQKKSRRHLRELLVEHRVLPEAEVDELFDHRAAEELYSLFTWTQGSFEFYKGPPSDPVVLARFDELRGFDANAVLMEVARRSDEWEIIIDTIRSIDELVVAVDGSEAVVTGDHLDVLRALDGRRTIRMLAPSTLFGLFELSRIVRDLLAEGQARFATVPEAIEAARQFLGLSRKKLANALLEALAARPEGHSYADLHAIATLFQEAGEQRRAAATLLTAATEADDPAAALEMLRDARTLAPRACEVLAQLRECLLKLDDPERDQELRQITDDYCNALIEEGRLADSLTILDQLEAEQPGDARLAFRRAIVLHKLGQRDEAVTGLMALAEKFKAAKQRDQLVVVYEQVLKIDPRRRDVTRALRSLQATRVVRQLRIAAAAAVAFAIGLAGTTTWRSYRQSMLAENTTQQVARLLTTGDVDGAIAAVAAVQAKLSDAARIAQLHAMIEAHRNKMREEAARERDERRRVLLAGAGQNFERGEFDKALATYAEALAQGDAAQSEDLHGVVRARFQSLLPHLERLAQELPYALPPAPGPTLDAKARKQAIEDLQSHFQDGDLLRARACLRGLEHPVYKEAVDADTSTRLSNACTSIVRTFGLADVRRTAYQSLEANAEVGRRLHPLVLQANEHEAQHRYKQAAEAYRTLAVEHPHEDDLKVEFRNRGTRAGRIAAGLDAIAAATSTGDDAKAWRAVGVLQSEYPEVPVGSLVRLPLRIESSPAGATVWIGSERAGTTPLRTTVAPAQDAEVRIALTGYAEETRRVTEHAESVMRVTLVQNPAWTASLRGAVTQAASTDGKTLVFAVDRAGHATALALADGRTVWSVENSDLSGLVPRALVFGRIVVVASVDGLARGLQISDGTEVWRRADTPVEVAPLACDDIWVAATTDRRLVALEAATGKVRFDVALPHTPSGLALSGRTVACALTHGVVLGLDTNDGSVRWRHDTGQVIATAPTSAAGTLFVVGEEGRVTALDAAGGEARWRKTIESLVAISPVVAGSELWVARDHELVALHSSSGEVVKRSPVEDAITTLGSHGPRLLVGTAKGIVVAFDRTDGRELVRFRGVGRATAPPLTFGDWLVLGFEGKRLQAYRGRP